MTTLCVLADVRAALGFTDAETARDAEITRLLQPATDALEAYANRNFTNPSASAETKRLAARGGFLSLPDLQAGEDYTLTRVSDSALLVEDDDYELEPVEAPYGVFTYAKLIHRWTPLSTFNYRSRNRRIVIDVHGKFGFTSIPSLAKRAAEVTVATWISKGVPNAPSGDGQGAPQSPPAVWAIPWDAKDIISDLVIRDL